MNLEPTQPSITPKKQPRKRTLFESFTLLVFIKTWQLASGTWALAFGLNTAAMVFGLATVVSYLQAFTLMLTYELVTLDSRAAVADLIVTSSKNPGPGADSYPLLVIGKPLAFVLAFQMIRVAMLP